MVDGFPRPLEIAVSVDVLDAVAILLAIGGFAFRNAAWNGLCLFFSEWSKGGIQALVVVHVMLIVVSQRVPMLANNFAELVDLRHDASAVFLPQRKKAGRVGVHAVVGEVSVREDAGVAAGTVGKVPSVRFASVVADQAYSSWTCEVGEESVTR